MDKNQTIHLINSLHTGGAETMLLKLIQEAHAQNEKFEIAALTPLGELVDELPPRWNLLNLYQLLSFLRSRPNPTLVCWMYRSCFWGVILKILAPRTRILWNIRHSLTHLAKERLKTRLLINALAYVSWVPTKIIFNSHQSREEHCKFWNLAKSRTQIIPNGFSVERFKPNQDVGRMNRDEWNVSEKHFVIGLYARFHPIKGHAWFFKTLNKLQNRLNFKLVLIGNGTDSNEIKTLSLQNGINERCIFVGRKNQIENYYPGLDLFVLPSISESFPNVLGETLLCGINAVATDAGESNYLLNGHGTIVPVLSENDLETAILNLSQTSHWQKPNLNARAYIEDHFSIKKIYRDYKCI